VEVVTLVAEAVAQVLWAPTHLTATQVVMVAQDTQVASLALLLIMQVVVEVVELAVQ